MKRTYLLIVLMAMFALSQTQAQPKKKRKGQAFVYTQHFPSVEKIAKCENKLEKLYFQLQGHFSNDKQADTATLGFYRHQELISIPIWKNRVGEYWIYQCRVPAGKPNFVVDETIISVKRRNRDTFEINYHQLNTNHKNFYAMEWLKENPFESLQPKDLLNNGCQSLVIEGLKGEFEIVSSGVCEYEMSNYIRQVDRSMTLKTSDFLFYSSFFDINGRRIFSYSREHPLVFQRLPHDYVRYDEKYLSANFR